MIFYLASPYSDEDPAVREQRFEAACRAAAALMCAGHHTYSPIAHSHPIARHGLPTDWDYWEPIDRKHLEMCDAIVVLTLLGWQESAGVRAEVRIARELDKPVCYIHPQALSTLEQTDRKTCADNA